MKTLKKLSGYKEYPEDIQTVAGQLYNKFETVRSQLKEENRDEVQKQLNAIERDFNMKLASYEPGGVSGTKERATELQRQLTRKFMSTGKIDAGLKEQYEKVTGKKSEPTVFITGDNEFIVPKVIDDAVMQVIRATSSLINRVHVVTAGAGYEKPLMRDGNAGRVSETGTRAVSDAPKVSNVGYTGDELYAVFQASNHSLQDAGFDLESEFTNAIGEAFAEQIESEIISGAGGTEFTGLNNVNDSATPAFGEIRSIEQIAAEIVYQDILNLILSVPKRYRRDAFFTMNSTTLAAVSGLKDNADRPIFLPSNNEQTPGLLLGYPVEEQEDVPGAGAGNRRMYFGNLRRGYSVHFVGDMFMIRDPYTRKGFTEFYHYRRVRGAVADTTGISVLKQPAV